MAKAIEGKAERSRFQEAAQRILEEDGFIETLENGTIQVANLTKLFVYMRRVNLKRVKDFIFGGIFHINNSIEQNKHDST